MVKLKGHEWDQLRAWFCPSPGYVLDFSNRTFKEFFDEEFQTNIYADAFSEHGTSKFSRLRSFIELSPSHIVIDLLNKLWNRSTSERDSVIETAELNWRSDYYNPRHVADLKTQADVEDRPFHALIAAITARSGDVSVTYLHERISEWTLDTVSRDFDRAVRNVEQDPEAAITAACSMLESVRRSVIVARGLDLPKMMDIQSLYKVAREPLGISPTLEIKNPEIEADVRTILAAIGNTVSGIGALRTHIGSAHVRERGYRRADERIARLAVNSACAICLFIVETWEKRYPEDKLFVSTATPISID